MDWRGLLLVLFAGINTAAGNLLLKLNQTRLPPDAGLVARYLSPYFLTGLGFYAVNVLVFAAALERLPVSVAYPVLAATGFALVTLGAAQCFGERLGPAQYVGLGCTLLGVLLLARQG